MEWLQLHLHHPTKKEKVFDCSVDFESQTMVCPIFWLIQVIYYEEESIPLDVRSHHEFMDNLVV